ncbi:MAG: hypothetical protein ACPHRO_09945, partial [Nannocystaceae bacterium]
LLVLAIGLFVHRGMWVFTCDDAYISFRYARNLAELGALTYDPSHTPPVEGYTNFLWVVLLAAGMKLGVAPEVASSALSFVAGLTILWLVRGLVGEVLPIRDVGADRGERQAPNAGRGGPVAREACGFLCASILVSTPMFVVWTSSGLETSFATALVLGALMCERRGALRIAAVLAALAVLTRPDAVVPLGGAILGIAGSRPRSAWPRREVMAQAALLMTVPLLLHLGWRRLTYDAWLPHTWEVKRHGAALATSHGLAYLKVWTRDLGLIWWLPLVAFVRRRHLPLALPVLASVVYVVSVGGDFMAYGRFLQLSLVLMVVLAGWVVVDFAACRGGRRWAVWGGPMVLTALAVSVLLRAPGLLHRDRGGAWLDGMFESVAAMDRFARVRLAAGAWMRENLPADLTVSVGAAGAMPFASGLSVVDTHGLVEGDLGGFRAPDLGAKARPGHQLRATLSYIKSRNPDLMCHAGYVGTQTPPIREARRRGRGDYRWACIPVGEIPLPLEGPDLQDVGTYCCLRKVDHIVGPFGGAE